MELSEARTIVNEWADFARRAGALMETERMRALCYAGEKMAMTFGHGHWDSTMSHGAGCEKCIAQRKASEEWRVAVAAALAAPQPDRTQATHNQLRATIHKLDFIETPDKNGHMIRFVKRSDVLAAISADENLAACPPSAQDSGRRVDEVKPSSCVGEHGSIKTLPEQDWRGMIEAVARDAVEIAIVRSELTWDESLETSEAEIAQDAADALFGDGTCADEPTRSAKQLLAQIGAMEWITASALASSEGPSQWKCKAQPTADPPQDCDWPVCGCDPYADKVIEALQESRKLAPPPTASFRRQDEGCICHGNWRILVAETRPLIGKTFVHKGERYCLFGLVYGDDDYYYGMSGIDTGAIMLLSCVGSIEGHGFLPAAGAEKLAGEPPRTCEHE